MRTLAQTNMQYARLIMSLDDRAKAIVAGNLMTALHIEIASRRANLGYPVKPEIPKKWACGNPDAPEEVFNTYLGLLPRLAEYDGSDHMKPELLSRA